MINPRCYDFDAALEVVARAQPGGRSNPLVIRVPAWSGVSLDMAKDRPNLTPDTLDSRAVEIYASDLANAALQRGRDLLWAKERSLSLERELYELRIELERERLIVARLERYTGVTAEQVDKGST